MSKLYVMVGLPASGKSTWAENNKDKLNAVIHSSDSIRAEFGDINDQTQNNLVFETLHKRVKEDLLEGKNVILDATNLHRRRRIHLISNHLRNVPCEKICILFATPVEICKKNNANRERKVPEEVIDKMVRLFDVPAYCEGWDDIQIVWWNYKNDGLKYNCIDMVNQCCSISHDNPHHTYTIGHHMIFAINYYINICEEWNREKEILATAILLHDCGKPLVKTYVNSYGYETNTAHYYHHEQYGSYISLFYIKDTLDFTDDEILHIALLIGLHMRPHMSWKQSDKAAAKDIRLFGTNIISEINVLHRCDLAAH